jgi:hypothetical protein
MGQWLISLFLILQSVVSINTALAQSTTTTAEADVQTSTESKPLPLTFSWLSMFYGPRLVEPTRTSVPSSWAGGELAMSVQNQTGIRFHVSDSVTITPTFDFEYRFTDPWDSTIGNEFALTYDSFIRFYHSNLKTIRLSGADLNFAGEVRWFFPTSDFSRSIHSLGSIRAGINPSLSLDNSNFSFSMVAFGRYWVQVHQTLPYDESASLSRFTLYVGPQVNYKVSERITAWVLYESLVTFDTFGIPNTIYPEQSLADVEPGVDIRLNDTVSITPYLNWFTSQPLKTISVNLNASIAI